MTIYRSPFAQWERNAAVRSFRPDQLDWALGGMWTPAGHLAFIECPETEALLAGPVGAAIILGHFHFTQRLENELISPVSSRLAAGHLVAHPIFIEDALRLSCDEGYHALLCRRFGMEVGDRADLEPPEFGEPLFLRHVRELRSALAGDVAPEDVDLVASVVSETIVTRTLGEDWHDPAVRPAIRAFLKMHHLDEARHSAFFGQALSFAWHQWDKKTCDAVEQAWDGLVEAFAAPDLDMMAVAFGNRLDADLAASLLARLEAESKRLAATADMRLTRRTLALAKAAAGRRAPG